jgi:hypothetical protein
VKERYYDFVNECKRPAQVFGRREERMYKNSKFGEGIDGFQRTDNSTEK